MNIAVLGGGNWGTTAALLLNKKGHTVRLWEYNDTLARMMIEDRENKTYLPGFELPKDMTVTWKLDEAIADTEIVFFVVPSSVMRQTARSVNICPGLRGDALLVSLSKGLERETMKTMTGIIGDEIEGHPLVVLSGPCIAGEVAQGLPTTIVAASKDDTAAMTVQDVCITESFRVYTSDDPLGVQLGGAVKNIIAIAAGINDGLGYGSNAKSALITRGIVEIIRLGTSLGANAETFNGLSGIGDLITTCVSGHSRNRHLGEELGKGRNADDILREMVMVAEGVPTTRSVYEYARRNSIDMPITSKVYSVLFEWMSPEEAVRGLMTRDRKGE